MGDQPESEISLAEAVSNLTAVVEKLNNRIKSFPTRSEVRVEGRSRALKVLLFGVVLILLAQFFTVTIISSCFLGSPNDSHPSACTVIPSYNVTIEGAKERSANLDFLLSEIEKNRANVREINLKVSILEARLENVRNRR